ncbi:hypothetical protein GGX14DRAFT_385803 [Mycena pura]|uniref:Uncharacterized protein n=1 Tax=Mycena pura TaxID=153505 RepID=A0AAD6YRD0_9AGAR|nr:hypothetical protein GGX14DRAFT_385803 [Mycena pura]
MSRRAVGGLMARTKLPPEEWFHAKVTHYWLFNWNDVQIANEIEKDMVKELQLHPEDYSIGYKSISRARIKLNLLGVRQQKAAGQTGAEARGSRLDLKHQRADHARDSVLRIDVRGILFRVTVT